MNKEYRCQFFTRREFETALYPLTHKDDYQLAAAATNATAGILSQYFNPNEIRESILFRAAAILAAWIAIDAARGREMYRRFCTFVERALPENQDVTPSGAVRIAIEKTEFELAELKRAVVEMPIRQVAQALVADHHRRKQKAA